MRNFIQKIHLFVLRLPQTLTPDFVLKRADSERFSIDVFVKTRIVPDLRKDDLLLDAGAGSFRYRDLLSKARYESCDFEDVFDKNVKGKHTFTCNLESIPKDDETYDVIVNTQVLEHVEHPEKVVKELARVLKKGGRLYLTTPQISHVHGAPYNFFFFTRFGLKSLFEKAGLEVVYIQPRGGLFMALGKIFNTMPSYLYYQFAYNGFKKRIDFKPQQRGLLRVIFLLPIYVFTQYIIGNWLPFILFYMDRFDLQKDYTLGYACFCRKK